MTGKYRYFRSHKSNLVFLFLSFILIFQIYSLIDFNLNKNMDKFHSNSDLNPSNGSSLQYVEKWTKNFGTTLDWGNFIIYPDLNDNGFDDIIVTTSISSNWNTTVFDHDGNILWSKDYFYAYLTTYDGKILRSRGEMGWYFPAFYDENFDGVMDVIGCFQNNSMGILDGKTGKILYVGEPFGSTNIPQALIEDFTGDGKPEIIMSRNDKSYGILNSSDKTMIWSNYYSQSDPYSTNPHLNPIPDIDGDNIWDIITGANYVDRIHCWSGANGSLVWTSGDIGFDSWGEAVCPDQDSDGFFDILVTPQNGDGNDDFQLLSGSDGSNIWVSGYTRSGDPIYYIDDQGNGYAAHDDEGVLRTYYLNSGTLIGSLSGIKWTRKPEFLGNPFYDPEIFHLVILDNDSLGVYGLGDYSKPTQVLNFEVISVSAYYGNPSAPAHDIITMNSTSISFYSDPFSDYAIDFNVTWENDASERKNFNFIDLNNDGKLELIRHMPNYETSIYTFTGNDCEFYDNIPISVYEFGDYDGDGINELVGMPATSYDYYFYYYDWESKILSLENIWDTGYDDRGKICFGDLDNDGKEEFVYADNGIAYGGHEGRRRVISYNGTGFEELKSFDDPSTQGWDGIADATMIDIDGDNFDEIVYSWGYNSGFDGGIRIYDDSSHSYSLLKEYWLNRDPTFLDQFDDHEDLNGDGNEDLVVGMASTWIDNYRYIIIYDSSTSSFSYQQLVKQVSNQNSMYGVGKLFSNDLYGRYVSFFCPDSGSNQYWTDVIRIYSWLGTSFGDPIEIKLDKIYYNHYYDLRLRVRDINGDGYDEIIWDGSDSEGKQVTHFIFFMSEGVLDTTPPTWIQIPSNQFIEFGNPLYYDLNATDPSGIDHWWINDTIDFQIDSNGVISNNSFLSMGIYQLKIQVNDSYDNVLSSFLKITVQDTTPPTWDQIPTDQALELGSGVYYDLNATDFSGIDQWWINDTSNFNIDGNGIITNITTLFIGQYWLEIIVYDPYGLNCSAFIKITVQDTTSPIWIQIPSDKTIELGSYFIYNLNASDLSGIDQWWINDTSNFNIDGDGVITNITSLLVGQYWLEIIAYDPYGLNCSAFIKITVQDTTPPIWIQIPSDKTIELGSYFIFNLNASDFSGIDQWWINDTSNFNIDGNGIITNITTLFIGQYWLEIIAYDPYGLNCSAIIKITVRDTTPPSWDQNPIDQSIKFGDKFNYDLNATDLSGIYQWWINDTSNFNIDGNGIITNITTLFIGQYWLEIIAYDPYGLNCSAIIKITVQDTSPPIWDQIPIDQVVEYGNNLIYDLNASSIWGIYQWWINDTLNFQISGNGTIINALPLSIGIYWLQVRAYNLYNTYCNTIITITVQDTTAPTFDPEIITNQILEYGNLFRLDLNASDLSAFDHWWINDTTHFIINDDGVIVNFNPLSLGTYSLEVRVYDIYNNFENGSFIIHVRDTIAPTITILAPEYNQSFGKFSPAYYISIDDISIEEYGLQSIWYTLDGGITTYVITDLIGVIDETLWDALPEGQSTIEFYVLDTSGNQGYVELIVIKELAYSPTTGSGAIPGYNLLIIGLISLLTLILIRKKFRK